MVINLKIPRKNIPDFLDQSESGVVMILVVIFMVVFFTFAALSIDLTAAAASIDEARMKARLVALSGIEEYFKHKCSNGTETCYDEKVQSAVDRASKIADFNIVLANHDGHKEINRVMPGDSPTGTESFMTLETGRWYATDDDENDDIHPCADYPCFNPTSNASQKINAFRIRGKMYNNFKTWFAGVFNGQGSFPIQVEVIASVIPRHGCFLADLSPSSVRDTHLGNPATEGDGSTTLPSQFAYLLSSDNPGLTSPTVSDDHWLTLAAQGTRSSDLNHYPTRHYQDDYKLKRVLSDSDYNSTDPKFAKHHMDPSDPQYARFSNNKISGNYRVDYQAESYGGPQPLLSTFEGINYALQLFKERAVAGDRACLIFYDDKLTWPRIVNLTDDFDYLLEFTDPRQLTDPKHDKNGNAYNLSDLNQASIAVRHGLFASDDAYSDTLGALKEAMRQFTEGPGATFIASDFIVHVGDGLTNCRRMCLPDDPNYFTSACAACSNDYNTHQRAMLNIKDFATNVLFPGKIPLHAILVGDAVAPNTVDLNDGNDQCLSDAKARQNNNGDYVFGGDPSVISDAASWSDTMNNLEDPYRLQPQARYYPANREWYDIARISGGIWGPIRKAGTGCVPDPCKLGEARFKDPYCRDTGEQIKKYMEDVMLQNPYGIVDSN